MIIKKQNHNYSTQKSFAMSDFRVDGGTHMYIEQFLKIYVIY